MSKHHKKSGSKTSLEKAVALRYDHDGDHSPRVVAKGEGHIARQIKTLAEKNGIPIHHDDDLVELLAQIDIDREIPEELYAVVAEMLSWIYRANDDFRKETG